MKKVTEFILGILILVLLGLVAHPMPGMTLMITAPLLVFAFGGFVALLWRERALDEREALHRMTADRVAFLVGACVALAGIIVEVIQRHSADVWLLFILGSMVLAKLAVHLYVKKDD